MARRKDKEKALQLRKKGWSYKMIKEELGVSKSTLSGWLKDHPLSQKRIRELQADNSRRIEKFRETMSKKRKERLDHVYEVAKKDIKSLNQREVFIGGLFLYWGEGLKAEGYNTSLSNTDASMIMFFISWLEHVFGIQRGDLKVKLHLYSDMNKEKEMKYWSQLLGVPIDNFHKPYIKKSTRYDITYKRSNVHGTCNINYYDRDVAEYVRACIEHIKTIGLK